MHKNNNNKNKKQQQQNTLHFTAKDIFPFNNSPSCLVYMYVHTLLAQNTRYFFSNINRALKAEHNSQNHHDVA